MAVDSSYHSGLSGAQSSSKNCAAACMRDGTINALCILSFQSHASAAVTSEHLEAAKARHKGISCRNSMRTCSLCLGHAERWLQSSPARCKWDRCRDLSGATGAALERLPWLWCSLWPQNSHTPHTGQTRISPLCIPPCTIQLACCPFIIITCAFLLSWPAEKVRRSAPYTYIRMTSACKSV